MIDRGFYSIIGRILIVLFLLLHFSLFGQDTNVATQPVSLQVSSSALLAVKGPPVILRLAGATEAGDSIGTEAVNSDSRLRISSLVASDEFRSISATISEPLVGTELYVEFGEPNANFGIPEQKGTLKGIQLLSSTSEVILVDEIGTCWSGKEADDGYVIKYSFKAIKGAPILKSADVTVTYTISLLPSELRE